MSKIATNSEANAILGSSLSPANKCPVYSDLIAAGMKAVSGYSSNQLVQLDDIESIVVDLSYINTYTGLTESVRTTANCYVVRTAGEYRIPLIYGNGIKNGLINSAAYTQIEGNYTAPFYNHLDNVITSPYIEENEGCKAVSYGVVWQDSEGVVSCNRFSIDNIVRYLNFTVIEVPTNGANAVIAIKDANGDIIWSWHIWLYADDLSPVTITNYAGNNYQILPVNLGSIKDGNGSKYFKSCCYQWGRKDPFPLASRYYSCAEGTIYNGTLVKTLADENTTVGMNHKNPLTYYYNYNSPYSPNNNTYECNYWDASCKTEGANEVATVKTIFDPCPRGFKIPNSRIFTGFTAIGENVYNSKLFNVVGDFDYGWRFKKNIDDIVGLYFPMTISRSNVLGSLDCTGGPVGGYWTSGYDNLYSYSFCFAADSVYPTTHNYRADGLAVRPTLD